MKKYADIVVGLLYGLLLVLATITTDLLIVSFAIASTLFVWLYYRDKKLWSYKDTIIVWLGIISLSVCMFFKVKEIKQAVVIGSCVFQMTGSKVPGPEKTIEQWCNNQYRRLH